MREEKQEEQRVEQREESPAPSTAPPMNLLATVVRLRRDLHRAEEQRTRVRSKRGRRVRQHLLQGVESETRLCVCIQAVEEQEEQELRCTQLKGDVRVYRQRNKQSLRQLEEVMRERDKVSSRRR